MAAPRGSSEEHKRKQGRRYTLQFLFILNAIALFIIMTPIDENLAVFIAWAFSPEWKGFVQGGLGTGLMLSNGIGWWASRMGD